MKNWLIILGLFFIISCGSQGSSTRVSGLPIATLNNGIEFYGGDGSVLKNPIIIKNAKNSLDGIQSEFIYIEYRYGEQYRDWVTIGQSTLHVGDRVYDLVEYQLLPEKTNKQIYFDITDFYGKF